MNIRAFNNIYKAYKIMLTLPVSQVECERGFSKLKIIKNRLRSSMSNDHLGYFIILSVEKELINNLKNDAVIDYLARTSNEWFRHLH